MCEGLKSGDFERAYFQVKNGGLSICNFRLPVRCCGDNEGLIFGLKMRVDLCGDFGYLCFWAKNAGGGF